MGQIMFKIEGIKGVPREWVERWIEHFKEKGYKLEDFMYEIKN